MAHFPCVVPSRRPSRACVRSLLCATIDVLCGGGVVCGRPIEDVLTTSAERRLCTTGVATVTTATRWRRGVVVSGVRRMNEVNARRARLVPGWVTVFGRVYRLDM